MRKKEKEEEIKEYFNHLSAEERIGLLSELQEEYCFHCGYKQEKNQICQCWNDE